ncbi:S-adenosyl-L-methionine-dependent methyltransferase [Rhizoclosmatium globosum]|uniref:S-adenosyl-L-methionine-dependent methyltransferase n=1 Tax=Rhizoclosmatium globosum TaxID=329046 RepID=A0A1Y2BXI6_9FUNG|nr:S-adenosyl-L-methionine-dependent methyltransferase [Rhizoclosmatium globosum]|eukprot:ORY39384.1 S-adenosyl-L-methionine-dependent methyltransferase [Rhizoclosmatium globosum]
MSQKRASEDSTTEHAAKHRTIASSEPSSRIRALEFFSGIGGLHYGLEHALKNTSTAPEVLAAFDINQIANSVYEHNFASKPSTKTIAVLTPKDIERYGHVDLWLLSPPCQPFTSGGKALDDKDDRSKPLLHLLDLLPKLASPPKYLFLENVPNFETSVCRNLVVTCLQKLGYEYQEYIVSPLQFGIPMIEGDTDGTEPNLTLDLKTEWPLDGSALTVPPLSEYLEDLTDTSPYLLPANYISSRPSFRFDIVRPESLRTSTVTKSYGTKMVTRSGSFLQTQKMEVVTPNFDDSASIIELGLRFLTPVEVARLHAFPIDAKESSPSSHKLEFPKSVSMGQQWKLLGNSLNVKVIGELMKHSFFSEQNERK